MDDLEELEKRIADLENEVRALRAGGGRLYRGVRRRSQAAFGTLPLVDIALGPDPEKGELRGHARGVIAIGDMATGVLALGGLSRGVIAIGGLALGLVTFGGASVGLLGAVGGLAIGGIALGGAAVGGVAVGGGAVGYYACGGGAAGAHVVDARRRDPEAADFFREHGLGATCDTRPGYRRLTRWRR